MKYIISKGEYMGDSPEMYSLEANNDAEAIIKEFAYGSIEDALEQNNCETVAELVDRLETDNGDGAPFIMIFNVNTNKLIFGEL